MKIKYSIKFRNSRKKTLHFFVLDAAAAVELIAVVRGYLFMMCVLQSTSDDHVSFLTLTIDDF